MIELTEENEIEAAFRHYRKRGFPYPRLRKYKQIHIFCKLQKSVNRINKRHVEPLFGGSRIITREGIGDTVLANYFHPHIWESHAVGMRSPIEAFHDDKSLRKVFVMCLKHYKEINDDHVLQFLKFVNGTQTCSNFRPAAAKAIYDRYKAQNVLDMSMGYGGRLLGFLASRAKGICVGVDPSKKTIEGNHNLAKAFGASHRVKLICCPFENVAAKELGEPDVCFTSPPYYHKEVYADEPTQSAQRYPTYQKWRKQFLFVMLDKTYQVLLKGGILALNIADITIRDERYPLVDDAKKFAEKLGFRLIDTFFFQTSGFGRGVMGPKWEPILIFRK